MKKSWIEWKRWRKKRKNIEEKKSEIGIVKDNKIEVGLIIGEEDEI